MALAFAIDGSEFMNATADIIGLLFSVHTKHETATCLQESYVATNPCQGQKAVLACNSELVISCNVTKRNVTGRIQSTAYSEQI